MRRITLVLLLGLAGPPAAATPLQDAIAQFERGEHAQAVAVFRTQAEQDNPGGQFALGVAHELGLGVAADAAEAAQWYRKAAAQGNPRAQEALAHLYSTGTGLERDPARAVYWRAKAARQDNRWAIETLPSDLAELPALKVGKARINVRSAPQTGGTVLLQPVGNTTAWLLARLDGGWLELYFEQDHTVGYVADFLMTQPGR